jgi:hypothetical protein
LGFLSLWGREGVTLAISMPAQKTKKGSNTEPKNLFSHAGEYFLISFVFILDPGNILR